jgi:hypothetical protein
MPWGSTTTVKYGYGGYCAFLLYGLAYACAITALSLDYIVKLTYKPSFSDEYITYCGWQEIHEDRQSSSDQQDCSNDNDCGYKAACDNGSDDSCKMEEAGKVYLSLVIIGLLLGLISLFGFFIHGRLFGAGGNIIFALFIFIAVGYFMNEEKCTQACEDSNVPNLLSCESEWGYTPILLIVAGALGIFSAGASGAFI